MGRSFEEKKEAKNYYEILEISPQCSQEEVNEAYNRTKNIYSGDSIALHSLMTAQECEVVLAIIEEAYSVLGDPRKRTVYDRARGLNPSPTAKDAAPRNIAEGTKHGPVDAISGEDFFAGPRDAKVSKVAAVNRFALEYTVDPKFEEEIDACQEFTGEFLRRVREYKKVDIPRMSDMTKVSKTYIKNIEDEDLENLPASVYIRGFVYQYAKTLRLNPDYVASSYINRFKKKT